MHVLVVQSMPICCHRNGGAFDSRNASAWLAGPLVPKLSQSLLQLLLPTCDLSAALNEQAVCFLHDVGLVQR